jgi:hypothetical protein
MAEAVASRTRPVVIVSDVSLATFPPTVSIPKAWNDAEDVAAPPMARSSVILPAFPGAMTPKALCQ